MTQLPGASPPADPRWTGPVSLCLGGFRFERRENDVTISCAGRTAHVNSHFFLRSALRVLAHDLALGKVIFYGGFCVHNLGDPVKGDKVRFSILGSPPAEEVFDKEEVRRFLGRLYEELKTPGYEEWY